VPLLGATTGEQVVVNETLRKFGNAWAVIALRRHVAGAFDAVNGIRCRGRRFTLSKEWQVVFGVADSRYIARQQAHT
jgi:hypothetical protein